MLNSHPKSSRWCFYFLFIVVALAFALAALLVGSGLAASGDLDPNFSLDGVTSAYLGTGTTDKPQVVYAAGSRIYTAGTSDGDLGVTVFTLDGSLDSSFDGDGTATYPFPGEDGGAFDLVLQDNKLLVAGFLTQNGGVEKTPAIFRLTGSGVLDSTFGSAGVVTSTVGTEAFFAALALDGSGNILAAGTVDGDALVAKFDANGTPDQNFGAMGVVRFSFGGVDGNEKIHALVVSGADVFVGGFTDLGGASDEFAVARLTLDTGSFVTTFGSNGQAIAGYAGTSNDLAYAMAVDSAGRILLAGHTDYGVLARQIAVTRLNATGSIDSSFGLAGWTVSDLGSLGAEAYAVDVLPTGKIMVSGWSDLTATAHDFSIVRLGSNGGLDTTFNTVGYRHVDLGSVTLPTNPGTDDEAYAQALQEDGFLLVAGYSDFVAGNFDFTVLRLETNDPPLLTDDSFFVLEDEPLNFTLLDFTANYSDADNDPLVSVTIQSLPANGLLTLDGSPVSAGQVLSAADLSNLIYTPAINWSGSDSFTWTASDGMFNAESDVTFSITVYPVNDAPTLAEGLEPLVLEDSGVYTAVGWASGITPGASDESSQELTLTLETTPGELFSVLPTIDLVTGTLSFTPAADANGIAEVSYSLVDDGGTANGGVDTLVGSFMITVTAVNDAPGFTGGGDVLILEDAGAQIVVAWATDILAGPPDEADQNLIFQVSPADPTLFSVLPLVDYLTGNLTYTPAENAFGQTTVEVVLRDSGGNANGGINVSPTVQFMLTITAVNDLPVVSDFSKTSMIDQPITLTYNDFNAHFEDVESELVSIRIESLPENGVLSLYGVPVIQGLVILANDLDGLVYSPTLNWWGITGLHWDGFDGEVFTGVPATVTLNVNPLAWPIFIPFVQVIY